VSTSDGMSDSDRALVEVSLARHEDRMCKAGRSFSAAHIRTAAAVHGFVCMEPIIELI